MKFTISLLLLALLTGCAKYVAMHAYVPTAPHNKPGNGIIIYVNKAVDNREAVKPKERASQNSPVGEYRGESPYFFTTHIFYFRSKEKPADIVTASVTGCLDSYGYIVKHAENIDSIPIPDAEADQSKYCSFQSKNSGIQKLIAETTTFQCPTFVMWKPMRSCVSILQIGKPASYFGIMILPFETNTGNGGCQQIRSEKKRLMMRLSASCTDLVRRYPPMNSRKFS
jgi:hypothetical protein